MHDNALAVRGLNPPRGKPWGIFTASMSERIWVANGDRVLKMCNERLLSI
jgi:hypothetical protein